MAKGDQHYLKKGKVSQFRERQGQHVHYQPLSVRAAQRQRAMARMHSGLKPMRFVSLHHHSTFSFLDGYHLPEAHVRRATEINMGAIAMTEHGNIFSHAKLEVAAKQQGVKPIYGCEFYTGWTDEERRTRKKNHLTVLAKNQEGYHNLLSLVTRSWDEGFYSEPTVDPRWLVEHQAGLIVMSGCQGSALFTALMGGKHVPEDEAGYKRALRVARWFAQRFEDYYVEVQAFPELERTRLANPHLARIARTINRPLVATMDCHYTAPEEAEVQQVLHAVRPGERRTPEELERDWGYAAPLCPPVSDKAIHRRLVGTKLTRDEATEAILSTESIAQECSVELPKLPRVRFPGENPLEVWRQWLKEGWHYRGIHTRPSAERKRYRDQLRHEMKLIEDKEFVGYFLIVADGVRFAKGHGIPVGPARGSAAASLCCYLLRITEVDPLAFPELSFERFLDPTRVDLPDIDLDFAPSGLPLLREFYADKYGEECVGSVGTFSMYKSKASVGDAAIANNVPKSEADKVKERLIERSLGDLRASSTVQDTFEQFDEAAAVVERYPALKVAMDLEGNARGFGTHASGFVVANGPITDVSAVLTRRIKGEVRQVIGVDKYDAELLGLEKLDFLSLATMEQIYDVLKNLGKTVEDLYAIPLDDPVTQQGFKEIDTVGVFQFDGRTMRFLTKALKPDGFNEIAHSTTLVRPGPMLSGASQNYIAVKEGAEHESVHPVIDAITQSTNYQVIFQEQILRIVMEFAGFDYTHRAKIRKIITAKKGEAEFRREWERFRDGAKRLHGADAATARQVWDTITTAGAYVFNAAHSYSYGMLAWWTMYLKRNAWGAGPAQFYASGLAHLSPGKDGERHEALRRDAARHDVALLPPDTGSGTGWRSEGPRTIVAGWREVPGVGPVIAERIASRNGGDLAEVSGVGPKTVDRIRAFQESDDPFGVYAMERALEAAAKAAAEAGLPAATHTAAEAQAVKGGNMVLLLQPFARNLRELFEVHRARTGEHLDPDTVADPDNTEWMLLRCQDGTDVIQLIFHRKVWPRFRKAVWNINLKEDVVLATGYKFDNQDDERSWVGATGMFHVTKLWVIDPETS